MGRENENLLKKGRPYWHLDAKWICGLLFVVSLSLTILIYTLYRSTEKETEIQITSTLLASLYSPKGLDDPEDLNKVREQFKESPDKVIEPFPGLDIRISRADIDNSSPREARIKIFRQLAEKLYNGEKIKVTGEDGQVKEQSLGVMNYLGPEGHQAIAKFLMFSLVVTLLLLAGLVFFSSGFGRLVSPALAVLFISIPGFLLSWLIKIALNKPFDVTNLGNEDIGGKISYVLAMSLPPLVKLFYENYFYLTVAGFGLIILALILKIIFAINRRVAAKNSNTLDK